MEGGPRSSRKRPSEGGEAPKSNSNKTTLNLPCKQWMIVSKEPCPICLSSTESKRIGMPNSCKHRFCLRCLKTWSKRKNTCPMCRTKYRSIIVRSRYSRRYLKQISVRKLIVDSREQRHRYSSILDTVNRVLFRLLGTILVHA